MPLVRRCAWHKRYHGFRLWLGVESWKGWRLLFTDGFCASCRERFASDWKAKKKA